MGRHLPTLVAVTALIWVLPAAAPADALPPVVTVTVAPGAFSPNADGIKDTTLISATSDVAASLSVAVTDDVGAHVRTLATVIPAAPGVAATFIWDGANDAAQPAPDGDYLIRVTADAPTGVTITQAPVNLDTRAPRVRWRRISPEPVRTREPVHFLFTSHDAAPTLDVLLDVADSQGDVGGERAQLRPGDRSIDWRPGYRNGSPLVPGLYEARLSVTDPAGNRTRSTWRAFRDHHPTRSKVFHRLGGTGGEVALTFDDCGDGGAWRRILRTLDDRNAEASFFCLGPNVSRFRAQARRTVADGHTVGSHSMNHALETHLGYAEIIRQNTAPQDTWWKVARTTPSPYFRPPYGSYDDTVLHAVGDAGYARTVIWDVDPRDWELPGSGVIADRVVANSRSGSIVVMHTLDGTAAALPSIISRLRARGLEPVSLDELFAATGMREPHDAGPVLRDPFE